MFNKKPFTIQEQIAQLQARGLEIKTLNWHLNIWQILAITY